MIGEAALMKTVLGGIFIVFSGMSNIPFQTNELLRLLNYLYEGKLMKIKNLVEK